MKPTSAAEIIRLLSLEPHPEGGWYRQSFSDDSDGSGRPQSTAIYYLLAGGQQHHWHRIDSVEIWHWYAGAPMIISMSRDGEPRSQHRLGPDIVGGERPQLPIPGQCWQRAESLGDWTLVGCTVSPGFQFSRFELAPPGWEPGNPSDHAAVPPD